MEYGKIIKQALIIAWRHKYLWVFGFFASMGGGGGNYSNFLDKDDASGAYSGVRDWVLSHLGLLALLIMAAIGLFIILMALYLISKGGLIKSVSMISKNEQSNFEKTLGYGLRYFWRMLGIDILLGLAMILVLGITIMPPILMMIMGGTGVKLLGAVWIFLLALPVIALLFCLGLVANFACQTAVVWDKKILEAMPYSYKLFRNNLGKSILLGLIYFGISILFVIAFVIAMVVMAIPFIILGVVNLWAGLVPGIVIGMPIILIISAIFGTFTSSYWTLGFLELSTIQDHAQDKIETVVVPDV
jgi:hypothetical protein